MARSVFSKTNFATIEHVGLETSPIRDFYHTLLKSSWIHFVVVIIVGYLLINSIFALLFFLNPGSVANVESGSFLQAFAFSVQTMATIGYGVFTPATPIAHVIVVVESITSLLYTAVVTGLTFSKFSRPTARVAFSRNPLLTHFEGKPALLFRMANARTNLIMQARVRIAVLKTTTTAEGYKMRRQFDLQLIRDNSMAFILPWTVVHLIDNASPLYGMSDEDMKNADLSLFIVLSGTDDIYTSEIHAFNTYTYDKLRHATKFEDMVEIDDGAFRRVNHRKIHDFI